VTRRAQAAFGASMDMRTDVLPPALDGASPLRAAGPVDAVLVHHALNEHVRDAFALGTLFAWCAAHTRGSIVLLALDCDTLFDRMRHEMRARCDRIGENAHAHWDRLAPRDRLADALSLRNGACVVTFACGTRVSEIELAQTLTLQTDGAPAASLAAFSVRHIVYAAAEQGFVCAEHYNLNSTSAHARHTSALAGCYRIYVFRTRI
jgi:hypothetical protein